MDFSATPVTLDALLSVRRKYSVSRNQREFSWLDEQLVEFWNDLVGNIRYESNEDRFVFNEYFLGALVLAGREDGFEQSIVDGQQRLTVVTVLLAAICEQLRIAGEDNYARGIYDNYIEGALISDNDDPTRGDARRYFKLERTSDSHYFKVAVQNFDKLAREPENSEDELLKNTYDFFLRRLANGSVAPAVFNDPRRSDINSHVRALRAIATQLTTRVKVIKVVVASEDDAYVIFEILNARGMDLDAADLIKNKLFSDLRLTHPIDFAKDKWDRVKTSLSDRNKNLQVITFVRHWWNCHYPVVSEGSLYKAFKARLQAGDFTSESFLERLVVEAELYARIAEPRFDDWREQTAKKIYFSFLAYKIFNVSINRPLVLALFEAFKSKKIRHADLARTLEDLEKFHFVFNAICSMRPSGIENSFSSVSRRLISARNRREGREIVADLRDRLRAKLPAEALFLERFQALIFTNQNTANKRLIQYVFAKMERARRGNDELVPLDMSLEHISPQAGGAPYMGMIGNLVPLSADANQIGAELSLGAKLPLYSASNYRITRDFAASNATRTDWTEEDVRARTNALGQQAYGIVWRIA